MRKDNDLGTDHWKSYGCGGECSSRMNFLIMIMIMIMIIIILSLIRMHVCLKMKRKPVLNFVLPEAFRAEEIEIYL